MRLQTKFFLKSKTQDLYKASVFVLAGRHLDCDQLTDVKSRRRNRAGFVQHTTPNTLSDGCRSTAFVLRVSDGPILLRVYRKEAFSVPTQSGLYLASQREQQGDLNLAAPAAARKWDVSFSNA